MRKKYRGPFGRDSLTQLIWIITSLLLFAAALCRQEADCNFGAASREIKFHRRQYGIWIFAP
jgi:hypothetical protein